MKNLLFQISFDGAPFHGWQLQLNAKSVQGEIMKAFYELTGEKATVTGCSRTDAGVHARAYYFNVHTDCTIPCKSFPAALGTKLPPSIAVLQCSEVGEGFNARFDCKGKEYEYLIDNAPVLSPFFADRALLYRSKLDEDALNHAASFFVGEHDFSAFCAAGSEVKTTVRRIFSASVTRKNEFVSFRVCGNGFLYNMVRIMAGTLLWVAEGKIAPEDLPRILSEGRRENAGPTLPAEGLYLDRVFYGSDFLEGQTKGTEYGF